jgi:hypothetical protein
VEELHKQVQQLQASQDTLQELLNDEEVQQVSCMLRLGLSTRSGFSVAPILSVIQFSEVQKMLSDACQDVAQAVEGIAAYLANTAPLLDAFLQAPVFRLGSEVQIFSGKKCKDSRQTIAKAVGLALVAAQDHLLRAELLVQLQDRNKWTGFSGDAAAAASFAELNTSLYNSNGGEQQGRQKGLVVQDVLLFCLRKHCSHSAAAVEAASNKTERVAAALLLGLLMKAGLMK